MKTTINKKDLDIFTEKELGTLKEIVSELLKQIEEDKIESNKITIEHGNFNDIRTFYKKEKTYYVFKPKNGFNFNTNNVIVSKDTFDTIKESLESDFETIEEDTVYSILELILSVQDFYFGDIRKMKSLSSAIEIIYTVLDSFTIIEIEELRQKTVSFLSVIKLRDEDDKYTPTTYKNDCSMKIKIRKDRVGELNKLSKKLDSESDKARNKVKALGCAILDLFNYPDLSKWDSPVELDKYYSETFSEFASNMSLEDIKKKIEYELKYLFSSNSSDNKKGDEEQAW